MWFDKDDNRIERESFYFWRDINFVRDSIPKQSLFDSTSGIDGGKEMYRVNYFGMDHTDNMI
jgi:hypothetical protein